MSNWQTDLITKIQNFVRKYAQEQEAIQKWHLDYIQLMEHIKNPKYVSHCADAEAQRIF